MNISSDGKYPSNALFNFALHPFTLRELHKNDKETNV